MLSSVVLLIYLKHCSGYWLKLEDFVGIKRNHGASSGIVVKALYYKPKVGGFKT
jgi:hypothetical protein